MILSSQDCEVHYDQEVKIRAMRFDIGVWVPKEREDSILKLTMKFEKLEEWIYHDKIELFRNEYRFTRRRGLHEKSQNESELSWEVTEGWGTFRVDIANLHCRLFYETLNGSKLLLEENCNMTLRSLKIEGSNVTLDCPKKLRTWEVAEEPAVIPLDKSKQHRITLYSTKDIYSSIKLGSKEYPLRWSNQTISSIEGKGPLPKYNSHNVTIGCESGDHEVVCFMKVKKSGKLLERVTLPEFPDHLLVNRIEGYAFTAILHLQNSSSAEKHPSGEGAAAFRDDVTDKDSHSEITIAIILLVTNLVAITFIACLCTEN